MARTYNNVKIFEKTVELCTNWCTQRISLKHLDIFHGKMPAIM